MKVIKTILVFALIALIMIQFVRTERNDAGYESIAYFEAETKPSEATSAILKKHCYDCHSDQTTYPWYAEFSPVNYWLEDHIKEGKKHFNASAWENYSIKQRDHKLEELIEMVEEGEMPLDSYTWLHGELPETEKAQLLQWANLTRLKYRSQIEVSLK